MREQRNFECPESGEPCVDPNCTADHCRETIRLRALENAPQEKFFNRSTYEAARRIVQKFSK
jgi:hypothetical protein